MPFSVRGPKGHLVVRTIKAASLATRLPALVRRFKKVTVAAAAATPLDIATSQLGVKESPAGSNRVKFSAWYGVVGPWCAMFVSWCMAQDGRKFHYDSVPTIVADAHNRKNGLQIVSKDQVAPNDVVCYDWGHDGVPDHTGIFEAWVTKGLTFHAIEGNTAVGNDSNGGEVMRRLRGISDVQAFVRVTP